MKSKNQMQTNKPNIVVITAPYKNIVVKAILANFIELLEPLSNELFAITGDFPGSFDGKIHLMKIKGDEKRELLIIRIVKYILAQLRITFNLIKISKNIDIVFFSIAAQGYLLPMLSSKLLGKKNVVCPFGSSPKIIAKKGFKGCSEIIVSFISNVLLKINLYLANQIAVESESIISLAILNKYRDKISINSAMYIDTDVFKVKKDIENRESIIGYIGRLSEEKGVMNFFKAIPLVLEEHNNLEFLIGGSGPLFNEIKEVVKNNKSYDKIKLTEWIPHEKIPDYLNELKLLVLPSFVEGVPGIVQEAMACGTPVLATPVGGVPDLIKDGETGFITESNSPECIAKNVIRALEHPDLDEIVKSARKLIEDEYSYGVMVRKCKDSLNELMKGK